MLGIYFLMGASPLTGWDAMAGHCTPSLGKRCSGWHILDGGTDERLMKGTTNDGMERSNACCIEIPLLLMIHSENDKRAFTYSSICAFWDSCVGVITVLYKSI